MKGVVARILVIPGKLRAICQYASIRDGTREQEGRKQLDRTKISL